MEEEKEEEDKRRVLGAETIAWEKVRPCCSVGPREKERVGLEGGGEGRGGGGADEGMYEGGEVASQAFWEQEGGRITSLCTVK